MTSSKPLSERIGKWVFWLMFAGMHVTFLPMHPTGFMGMPRRVYTYLPGMDLEITNLISTAGSYMIGAGVLLFLMALALNFRFTFDHDPGNAHGAGTLAGLPTGPSSPPNIPVIPENPL